MADTFKSVRQRFEERISHLNAIIREQGNVVRAVCAERDKLYAELDVLRGDFEILRARHRRWRQVAKLPPRGRPSR